MKRAVFMATCIALTSQTQAGTFSLSRFGPDLGRPVSHTIADLVSDDFTTVFPAEKYEIVVIYQHAQVGNDNICYAVAGVAKKPNESELSSVPIWRFTSTEIDRNTGSWNIAKIRDCMSSAIRSAVENMMSVPAREIKKQSEL